MVVPCNRVNMWEWTCCQFLSRTHVVVIIRSEAQVFQQIIRQGVAEIAAVKLQSEELAIPVSVTDRQRGMQPTRGRA